MDYIVHLVLIWVNNEKLCGWWEALYHMLSGIFNMNVSLKLVNVAFRVVWKWCSFLNWGGFCREVWWKKNLHDLLLSESVLFLRMECSKLDDTLRWPAWCNPEECLLQQVSLHCNCPSIFSCSRNIFFIFSLIFVRSLFFTSVISLICCSNSFSSFFKKASFSSLLFFLLICWCKSCCIRISNCALLFTSSFLLCCKPSSVFWNSFVFATSSSTEHTAQKWRFFRKMETTENGSGSSKDIYFDIFYHFQYCKMNYFFNYHVQLM